jgi:hypothetical protein
LRPSGEARIFCIDPAHPVELEGVDLLVVGSPTQGWRPIPAMRSFLEGSPRLEADSHPGGGCARYGMLGC